MAIVMQTRMRRAFAMHLGPHLGLWVPNRARSRGDFKFLGLKGAAAAEVTAAASVRLVPRFTVRLSHCYRVGTD